MNFSQMLTLFYDKFRESSSNSTFSETKVKKWINEGYRYILDYTLWDFLVHDDFTTNIFTSCSDVGTSTGTTLYVDSINCMQAGMILHVTDGTIYERVEISSINEVNNVATLRSPGLVGEYTDGDTVSSTHIFLPCDLRKLIEISARSVTGSSQDAQVLRYCDDRDFNIIIPYKKSLSMPTHYIRGGISVTNEGYPGTYTAGEGTNINAICSDDFTGPTDDYYKDWRVVNTTRGESSRATSYNSETKAISMSPAIACQQAEDKFYLIRDLGQVFLYPIPDKQYTYYFRYYRRVGDLSDSNDIPALGEGGDYIHDLPVDYALAEAYLCDRKPEMASYYRQKFLERIERMRLSQYRNPDYLVNFRPTGSRDLPGFYV